MFLTAFFFPSLPVLLAAVMALPVFALTRSFLRKRLNVSPKNRGNPLISRLAFTGFTWSANGEQLHYCRIFSSLA